MTQSSARPPRRVRFIALRLAIAAAGLAVLAHAEPVALKTTELGHGPAIVFVHGLGGSRTDWLPTARKLLASHRVVLVDLPGHGDSPLPEPFSFAAVGEALDAVLAKQNAESTIVVGQDAGGRAALAALAVHPGRAKGVLLIDVGLGTPVPLDDQQKKAFLDFMEQSYDQFATRLFSSLGRDSTQSAAIYAIVSHTAPATVKAYLRAALYSDGNRDVKALKVPFRLALTSKRWKPGTPAGATLARLGWQDTTVAVARVPDSAYWVMKDQPDSLAAMIQAFATASLAPAKK